MNQLTQTPTAATATTTTTTTHEDIWIPSDSLSKDQQEIVEAYFDDSECTKLRNYGRGWGIKANHALIEVTRFGYLFS